MIEEHNLLSAILVTSRYEQKEMREKIGRLGIAMVPKSMSWHIPLSIENGDEYNKQKSSFKVTEASYDAIYIDDDEYLRWGWEKSAKENGIKLLALSSTEELGNFLNILPENINIYIDRELGDNQPKGEIWAKDLHRRGFKNLYLTTGYHSEDFPLMPWIKEILSKEPPWENQI